MRRADATSSRRIWRFASACRPSGGSGVLLDLPLELANPRLQLDDLGGRRGRGRHIHDRKLQADLIQDPRSILRRHRGERLLHDLLQDRAAVFRRRKAVHGSRLFQLDRYRARALVENHVSRREDRQRGRGASGARRRRRARRRSHRRGWHGLLGAAGTPSRLVGHCHRGRSLCRLVGSRDRFCRAHDSCRAAPARPLLGGQSDGLDAALGEPRADGTAPAQEQRRQERARRLRLSLRGRIPGHACQGGPEHRADADRERRLAAGRWSRGRAFRRRREEASQPLVLAGEEAAAPEGVQHPLGRRAGGSERLGHRRVLRPRDGVQKVTRVRKAVSLATGRPEDRSEHLAESRSPGDLLIGRHGRRRDLFQKRLQGRRREHEDLSRRHFDFSAHTLVRHEGAVGAVQVLDADLAAGEPHLRVKARHAVPFSEHEVVLQPALFIGPPAADSNQRASARRGNGEALPFHRPKPDLDSERRDRRPRGRRFQGVLSGSTAAL